MKPSPPEGGGPAGSAGAVAEVSEGAVVDVSEGAVVDVPEGAVVDVSEGADAGEPAGEALRGSCAWLVLTGASPARADEGSRLPPSEPRANIVQRVTFVAEALMGFPVSRIGLE
jgi:hypothetical protein